MAFWQRASRRKLFLNVFDHLGPAYMTNSFGLHNFQIRLGFKSCLAWRCRRLMTSLACLRMVQNTEECLRGKICPGTALPNLQICGESALSRPDIQGRRPAEDAKAVETANGHGLETMNWVKWAGGVRGNDM